MGLVRQSGGSGDPSPLGQKENFPERTRLRAPPPGSQPRTSSHPAAPKALPGRVTPFVVANNEQQAEGSTGLGRGEPGRLHPAGRLGARGRMKDAASTDVIVPAGVAVASFWQCGDLYLLDPLTLDDLGKCRWGGSFPAEAGVSAHTKVDDHTGELLFFNSERPRLTCTTESSTRVTGWCTHRPDPRGRPVRDLHRVRHDQQRVRRAALPL